MSKHIISEDHLAHVDFDKDFLEAVKTQAAAATKELCEIAKLKKDSIFIIGCSSSEVAGEHIGTFSSPDIAASLYEGIQSVLLPRGIKLAAQCCEHLNRAIIIDAAGGLPAGSEPVNVVPQPKAGGSFATVCYKSFTSPVALETIKADAGIDIGGTLIGMHLKPVAVPVRLETKQIGNANIIAARTRPKFIGGIRATYDKALL